MNRLPVVIDTDGQLDSFWGIMLAKQLLDVKAVTVCKGKSKEAEQAFENTGGFLTMAGLQCHLSKGSERPVLISKKVPEQRRFLPDGKCGLPFPKGAKYDTMLAWDRIYQEAKEAEGELVVVCFGPMTNLALAIFKYPELPSMIKKVAFVGGSYDFGNVSAVVEENMAADPEAAKAVFQSGILMGMDGYHFELKSALTNAEVGKIVHGANGPYTTAFAMSGMSHRPGEAIYYGPALAVFGLGMPEHVTFERYNIFVETKGELSRGRVVPLNMYTPLGYPKDTKVAMDLDREAYMNLLKETLDGYEKLE